MFFEERQALRQPVPLRELGYTTVLLVHNPASSYAKRLPAVRRRLEATQEVHQLDITEAKTAPDVGMNALMLDRCVTPQTAVLVHTGDGGASSVLTAALRIKLPNPIGMLPGGRKNDLAHDHHSWRGLHQPDHLLTHGLIKPMHPIAITSPGQQTRYAWNYTGRGMNSAVAERVNDPAYRQHWMQRLPGGAFIVERRAVADAFRGATPYPVAIDGLPQEIIDYAIINIAQMAGNLHSGTNSLRPELALVVATTKYRAALKIAAMRLGLRSGRLLTNHQAITIHHQDREFIDQADGEPQRNSHDGGLQLTFQASHNSVNALVTKRR